MASLVKFAQVAAKLSNKTSLGAIISVRNHWNKDFKPGPYPKTQAEREAAAKKYNLPIEEYEVYPDDGLGYGDYPKLKRQSVDLRDPFYPWDYPEHRRNFNEPIHADIDEISEDRCSTGKKNICCVGHESVLICTTICFSENTLLFAGNVGVLLWRNGVLWFFVLLLR